MYTKTLTVTVDGTRANMGQSWNDRGAFGLDSELQRYVSYKIAVVGRGWYGQRMAYIYTTENGVDDETSREDWADRAHMEAGDFQSLDGFRVTRIEKDRNMIERAEEVLIDWPDEDTELLFIDMMYPN